METSDDFTVGIVIVDILSGAALAFIYLLLQRMGVV